MRFRVTKESPVDVGKILTTDKEEYIAMAKMLVKLGILEEVKEDGEICDNCGENHKEQLAELLKSMGKKEKQPTTPPKFKVGEYVTARGRGSKSHVVRYLQIYDVTSGNDRWEYNS